MNDSDVDLISQLDLKPETEIKISRFVKVQDESERRVVLVMGAVYMAYDISDRTTELACIGSLAMSGLAKQKDLVRGFDLGRSTVYRAKVKFEEEGVSSFVRKKPGPRGPRLRKGKTLQRVKELYRKGYKYAGIAKRLGISAATVCRMVKEAGLRDHFNEQSLTLQEARGTTERSEAEESGSQPIETAPGDGAEERVVERAMAATGMLEEAATAFVSGKEVPGAGSIMALGLFGEEGLFEIGRKVYGRLSNGFYGLRNTFLTLALMAVNRIKRPEGLKVNPPRQLGRLIGLDRVPEVKTLRRKLTQIALFGKARDFIMAIGDRRLKELEEAVGMFYCDGHVRVYSGKRDVAKAYVAQRRLAMPAACDYWVNDHEGEPIFVVTARHNEQLVQMLPGIIAELKSRTDGRKLTVIFDRGGWSHKLFKELKEDVQTDFITYRKGKFRKYPKKGFERKVFKKDGREYEYKLCERDARMGKAGRFRCVAILRKDGRQTQIVTTRWDLPPEEIAYWMFNRWRQENFFKYMQEHFDIDGLVSYDVEADTERMISNPKREKTRKAITELEKEIAGLKQKLGEEVIDNEETEHPTVRGFKIAHVDLRRELVIKEWEMEKLKARLAKQPKKVLFTEVAKGRDPVAFNEEKRRFTYGIKMLAYRVENRLLSLIWGDYARAEEEGRALIREIMKTSGDLIVKGDSLHVALRPLSSPHRTRSLESLCNKINGMNLQFPETSYRLSFSVKEG